jgi:hypothetical protein
MPRKCESPLKNSSIIESYPTYSLLGPGNLTSHYIQSIFQIYDQEIVTLEFPCDTYWLF